MWRTSVMQCASQDCKIGCVGHRLGTKEACRWSIIHIQICCFKKWVFGHFTRNKNLIVARPLLVKITWGWISQIFAYNLWIRGDIIKLLRNLSKIYRCHSLVLWIIKLSTSHLCIAIFVHAGGKSWVLIVRLSFF